MQMRQVGGRGLPGLVFMCGQRVWRLPPQLGNATHALIWPWDTSLTRSMDLPVQVMSLMPVSLRTRVIEVEPLN